MKLELTNLKIAHKALCQCPLKDQDSCNEFEISLREKSEDEELLKKAFGFKYPLVGLPSPFLGVELMFRRSFNTYDAYYTLYSKTPDIFKGVSGIFREKILGSGLELSDYGRSDGIGIVIDPSAANGKKSLIGIISPEKKGRVRDFGIGCNGASPRYFSDDYTEWIMDTKEPRIGIEPIFNLYLEACFENYAKARSLMVRLRKAWRSFRGERFNIPNHPIYLNI